MWYVYILECSDGTFYTGIATDLERRVREHNKSSTVSAKYTRYRRPVKLVYQEEASTRSEALKREKKIKRLPRDRKKSLLIGHVAQR